MPLFFHLLTNFRRHVDPECRLEWRGRACGLNDNLQSNISMHCRLNFQQIKQMVCVGQSEDALSPHPAHPQIDQTGLTGFCISPIVLLDYFFPSLWSSQVYASTFV